MRVVSIALIAIGLVLGTALDTRRAGTPVEAGGYFIVAADFHVHAFPGDGTLPAWELAREASRRGLHAVVISNHNQTLAPLLWAGALLPGPRALIIPAQEITTPRFHMIGAGISRTIDWRKPGVEIVRDIHAQGGVAIVAHPTGRYWPIDRGMWRDVDGTEVAHPLTNRSTVTRPELTAFFTRVRAVNPDVAPIGSSDYHMVAPLGLCRTYVFAESVTMRGILDAIRAGRTVAQDQDGVLYGAPALTHLMDGTRAAFPQPPTGRSVQFAALMVLLGFLGLVTGRPSTATV